MKKMDVFKLEAFLQEFPFLQKIIDEAEKTPDTIRVKKVDRTLLEKIPVADTYIGCAGTIEKTATISFVADDICILDAVTQEQHFDTNIGHPRPIHEEGEAVLEAIHRHRIAETLLYIVEANFHYNNWENEDYINSFNIVLYKAPKGLALNEIIRAQENARTEVKIAVDF